MGEDWTPERIAELLAANPGSRMVYAGTERVGPDEWREKYKLEGVTLKATERRMQAVIVFPDAKS